MDSTEESVKVHAAQFLEKFPGIQLFQASDGTSFVYHREKQKGGVIVKLPRITFRWDAGTPEAGDALGLEIMNFAHSIPLGYPTGGTFGPLSSLIAQLQ